MPDPSQFYLELDKTAQSLDNLIQDEIHETYSTATRLILPKYGAFYEESLVVYSLNDDGITYTTLDKGVDYVATEMLHKVTQLVGKEVCSIILVTESSLKTKFKITYQALGGHDQVNRDKLFEIIENTENAGFIVQWGDVLNKPKKFAPAPHLQDSLDIYGLEYITAIIDKIDEAITVGDRAANQALISKIVGYEGEIYIEDGIQEKVDTIMALVKSANDLLTVVSGIIIETTDTLDKVQKETEVFIKDLADYKAYSENDKVSNVINLLAKRQYDLNGNIIEIPTLFSGLELFIDSESYNESTGAWTDKYTNSVTYTSSQGNRPLKSESYAVPGTSSLKFTNGVFFSKVSGTLAQLKKNKTIITITSPLANKSNILLEVFNDEQAKLKIDTQNEVAYKYSDLSEQNVSYLGKISSAIGSGPIVNVACIGDRAQDCLVIHNSPFKIDLAPNGIWQNSLSLDDISSSCLRIGSPDQEQEAEVFMILVYDRLLSRAEIHAIMTYVRLKYGAQTQSLMNADFTHWDDDFGSDMDNFINFNTRNTITVTDQEIVRWDPTNVYSQPGITNKYDIKIDDNPYLFVVSSDANKAFWRQLVDLDPHCRYELSLSVIYGQLNPPIIRIKVNDVFLSDFVRLTPGQSIERNIIFSFTPNTRMNKIEFFNLNESTVHNCFGIGAMRLVRKIYPD